MADLWIGLTTKESNIMTEKMSYFRWIHEAHTSQKYADDLRSNPRSWTRYYIERVVCTIVLLAITIAGFLAFVNLLANVAIHP